MHNNKLHKVAFVLLALGGLNWLFYAFNFNLIMSLFGGWPMLETLVYILIGLSAIYEIATHKHVCKHCECGPSSGDGSGDVVH